MRCCVAVGLTGCPEGGGSEGSGGTGGTGGTGATGDMTPTGGEVPDDGGLRPRETDWRVVVDDLGFPAEVSRLTVGRVEYNGNFANRGDVEVYFDRDTPTIRIEMRVYDFSDGDYFPMLVERMYLWAYTTGGNPDQPSKMPAEDDCTVGAWKDDCKVYAYYDGQAQPVRSGADLRVHLPRSYRGAIEVVTEDNRGQVGYTRLGDVVVDGVCGNGVVSLAQGHAAVKLCRELTPTPTCPADQVAVCEAFKSEMGEDAAWSPNCPCKPNLFGQLTVLSRAPWASEITVDVPDTTWINVHVANEESDRPHPCVPEIAGCEGDHCVLSSDTYKASAEYNYPGPAAPAGAGFDVSAVSAGCGPVDFYADPEAWSPGSAPTTAVHGHVRVCTGCL